MKSNSHSPVNKTLTAFDSRMKGVILGIKDDVPGINRMACMGLIPGVRFEVVSVHPGRGPVVIMVDNAKIAIGRSLAERIEAEPAE